MRFTNYRAISILVVVLSSLLFIQAVSANGAQEAYNTASLKQTNLDYWPTEEWQFSTPEEQGMNSDKLDEAMAFIHENEIRCDGLVVIRNGYIVYEAYPSTRYSSFTMHRLYSTTKSVLSALIGIAVDHGNISSIDTPVLDYFPDISPANPSPEKEMMTLRHLLTMTAGVEWDEHSMSYSSLENPIGQMYRSTNPPKYFLDRPMAATPGDVWVYNSGCSLLLSHILNRTTGMKPLDFAYEYLFGPLGIDRADWYADSTGIHSGAGELFLTPRDLAKIGYLFLNNGTWDQQTVISKDWVNESTTHLTENQRKGSYIGYGLHWWTVPGLNLYFTAGLYGQEMYVDTTHNMIAVFTGSVPVDEAPPWLSIVYDYILPSLGLGISTSETNSNVTNGLLMVMVIITPLITTGVYWLILKRKYHP